MDQTLSPFIKPWSYTKKIFFRFGFLSIVLLILFKPNQSYTIGLYNFYIQPFIAPIQWMAKHILHISYPVQFYDGSDGGADDLFDYLSLLTALILAVGGTVLWTLLDKKRKHYRVLHYWFTAILRYYLALSMFQYGSAKLVMLQFREASPYQLSEPFGMSSPMGLAWEFFGYSRVYNYFLGIGELTAAVLLLFRRTVRLGAIIMLVVTVNVMVLNYCYDIVVKEVSTILVVMSFILLLQDYRHHAAFFIHHRQTEPVPLFKPSFQKKWMNTSLIVSKYAIIVFAIVMTWLDTLDGLKIYGPNVPKPVVYGIYDAETYITNKDTLAPLTTDTIRWRKLIIGNRGIASIKLMNDSTRIYEFETDSTAKTISLNSRNGARKASFDYMFSSPGTLLLKGLWKEKNKTDSLKIILKKLDLNKYRLVRSQFHFINEFAGN